MGSWSGDELAAIDWVCVVGPELLRASPQHELLQYWAFGGDGSLINLKSEEAVVCAFYNRFWQRPDTWEDQPGAAVRAVTFTNFCLAAEEALKQLRTPAA